MRLCLPWPPRSLHPNSRRDRRASTRQRADYKSLWWGLTKEAKAPIATHLDITFRPPDRRRRDLDGMLSAIKYGLDGMALAMGVDDADWSISMRKGEPVKDGAVIVDVRP